MDSSLSRPKLDTTVVLDGKDEEVQPAKCPLFALVSVNTATAPSVEVPWSQLLALSLVQEEDPPVLTVGRSQECHVQVTDARVSSRHFEVIARRASAPAVGQREDSGDIPFRGLVYECVIHDSSSNGTAINGKTVGKGNFGPIRSGDEICVLPAEKVGQDSMIAFVFRNTTEILASPREVCTLNIEDLVLCPICIQPIYKCVALMPCFHNFCMACCSEWVSRREQCPVCRRPFAAIMKNHPMEAVVDCFLEANPDRQRSEEELRDMDSRDNLKLGIGGKIVRDVCSVGTSTAIERDVTEPLENRSRSASREAGTRAAASRRAHQPRSGSQICVVQ